MCNVFPSFEATLFVFLKFSQGFTEVSIFLTIHILTLLNFSVFFYQFMIILSPNMLVTQKFCVSNIRAPPERLVLVLLWFLLQEWFGLRWKSANFFLNHDLGNSKTVKGAKTEMYQCWKYSKLILRSRENFFQLFFLFLR